MKMKTSSPFAQVGSVDETRGRGNKLRKHHLEAKMRVL